MKYEWRKKDKALYLPKDEPAMVRVPEFQFFMLSGKGNPNGTAFSEAVEALFSLSYAVKMLPKKGVLPPGYFEYTVFPLEGVWDLSEEGRKKDLLDKDELIYTLMIRQPGFLTESLFQEVLEFIKKKKPNKRLSDIRLKTADEGLCVQILHSGTFDDEPQSFGRMDWFCLENGLKRSEHTHREIYLTDARKTPPEKQKTVLRYRVIRANESI